jgi:WD40 repeat protein
MIEDGRIDGRCWRPAFHLHAYSIFYTWTVIMGRGRRKTKGHHGSSKARTGNTKHKRKKQIPPPDTAKNKQSSKKPRVEIPTSIIVAHIIPFLSRNTWNNVAMANKELKQATRYLIPPWPNVLINLRTRVYSLAFAPCSQQLACGDSKYVRLWDRRYGPRQTIMASFRPATTLIYSPDGAFLACHRKGDSEVRVWHLVNRKAIGLPALVRHRHAPFPPIVSIAISSQGELASIDEAGKIEVRRLSSLSNGLEPTRLLQFPETIDPYHPVAFSPDLRHMAVSRDNSLLHMFRMNDRAMNVLQNERNMVDESTVELGEEEEVGISYTSVFSPDGKFLVRYISHNHATEVWGSLIFEVWDLAVGSCKTYHQEDTTSIFSLSFSPDGQRIAIGGEDGKVRMWNLADDEMSDIEIFVVDDRSYRNDVNYVAFSPDKHTLAAASRGSGGFRLFTIT